MTAPRGFTRLNEHVDDDESLHASGPPSASSAAVVALSETPITPQALGGTEEEEEGDDDNAEGARGRRTCFGVTWKDGLVEAWEMLKFGGPNTVAYLLQMVLGMVMALFIGHWGTARDLAAVALGNMFCNVTGLSMGMGMATAMDTLISQAYGHSPKSPLVGIIFQRGMLILMLMCVPIAAVWLSAEPILIAFQQDPEVAQLAGLYARLFLPGLPFIFLFECWRKYLQGQGIMYVSTLATLVGLIVNIMCCYLFIFVFGLGFAGAPIAMSVTGFSMPTFTWAFVHWRGLHKNTWYGFSKRAFSDWPQFFRFGVPGMIMLMNEWWSFEIVALMAGVISDVALAAQTVVLSTATLMFMITFGVAIATNVRVGNALGAGDVKAAKRSAVVGTMMGLCTALGSSVILLCIRNFWGYLFSDDEEVVHLVASVLLIYSIFAVFDGAQALGGAIIRGAGKQHIGAIFNFVGFYVVGLPFGYFLCFKMEQGLWGLWWGLCGALLICASGYFSIIYRMDWHKESVKAQDRVKQSQRLFSERDHDEIALVPSNADGLPLTSVVVVGERDHDDSDVHADGDDDDYDDGMSRSMSLSSTNQLLLREK